MSAVATPDTLIAKPRKSPIWSLGRSAKTWFVITAIGQLAFVWMILVHYGGHVASGDLAGWNEKPLIKGYVAGDGSGNFMFALHTLLAAVVIACGLLQLVPAVRKRTPLFHRWAGRTYFSVGMLVAANGLWLTWVRDTYLSLISAVAVSLNGVLVLVCCSAAWLLARNGDFAAHRRWALRSFMVVSGVWFLRIGIMAWVLLTGGGIGMNRHMSGPADVVLQFGAFLIPLLVLEFYFRAQHGRASTAAVSFAIYAGALITLIGVGGAISFMWGPYMI